MSLGCKRCKIRAFSEVDKYESALKIGDAVHLFVDNTLMHEIECPMDDDVKIGEVARCIHALVENGCVTAQIVKPTEEIVDELITTELGLLIDTFTDLDNEIIMYGGWA